MLHDFSSRLTFQNAGGCWRAKFRLLTRLELYLKTYYFLLLRLSFRRETHRLTSTLLIYKRNFYSISATFTSIHETSMKQGEDDILNDRFSWFSCSYFFLYLLIGFYIPPLCANTSEWSAGSRVWCLGSAGF